MRCYFGVAIAADHPHDTVAGRKDGDRGTYSDDFPRDFQAQKSGAAEVRTAVPASALGQVGTVQARGANADQKIGQPQFGFGYLGDLQDVGVAKSSNRIGFMIRSPRVRLGDAALAHSLGLGAWA